MDKQILLNNIFQSIENLQIMRDSIEKSFGKILEKNLAKQPRFTVSCKAKDLNKTLKKHEQVIKKIISN